jgi:hypothetical protein
MVKHPSDSSTVPGVKLFHTLRSRILVSFGLLIVAVLALLSIVRTFGLPFASSLGSYEREEAITFQNLGVVCRHEEGAPRFLVG